MPNSSDSLLSNTPDTLDLPSVDNTMGLAALAYRVGTHASFKAAMVQELAGPQNALRSLARAGTDDPTMALVDAWAATLDVLTFYQERIANEGYLRTATEQRSVQELGRAVGYELNPGVAAETYLAFTLDDTPGAPEKVTIDAGTKVQSVPGPGEQPQVFETVEKIEARPEWNALKPRMTEPRVPSAGDTEIYLTNATTGLKPGDVLLFVSAEREQDPLNGCWALCRVKDNPVPDANGTKVTLDQGLAWEEGTPQGSVNVYALRQRAALFGYNAPDWRAMPRSVKLGYKEPDDSSTDDDFITYQDEWPGYCITRISAPGGLCGEYFDDIAFQNRVAARIDWEVDFSWGSDSPYPVAVPHTFSARWSGYVLLRANDVYTFRIEIGSASDQVSFWIDNKRLLNYDQNSYSNNPLLHDVTYGNQDAIRHIIKLEYGHSSGDAGIKLSWASESSNRGFEVVSGTRLSPLEDQLSLFRDIQLDALYPRILPPSWLVLSSPTEQGLCQVEKAAEDSCTGFTVTAKTTRLTLKGDFLRFDHHVRETTVFAQSELVDIAEAPISEDAYGDYVTLDQKIDGFANGQIVIVSGKTSGLWNSEMMTLLRTEPDGDLTKLVFTASLEKRYERGTLTINANVARSTHGDTRQEVLGSADAAQSFQQLPLRQSPLTFAPAATPSGGASTLQVRANDILWDEKPTLYGAGPRDRVFTAKQGPDGKFIVQFGDGTTGARPPSGDENVSATYRVGLGEAGNVKSGQLRVLLSRLLGVRGVTNPQPAAGGADPEGAADARQNVPYQALTLDRIVSLRDYEDFARAFGGVGKARADWLWDGSRGVIYVTVVDAHGKALDDGSRQRLEAAMVEAHDPAQYFETSSTDALRFCVNAQLILDPHWHAEQVLEKATAALRQAFSLTRREFGQDVTESEILSLLQSVEGVIAANVIPPYPGSNLKATDWETEWKSFRRLTAQHPAYLENAEVQLADLWLLDESLNAISLHPVTDFRASELEGGAQ